MTEDDAIRNINRQLQEQGRHLERQGEKLDSIQSTLQQIAVQDEQIRQLQDQQSAMWGKIDSLCASDGPLAQVRQWQAGCPRNQIKYLWVVVIPMGLTMLGTALALIKLTTQL